MNKLRVYHIPQVPMKPFLVEVTSVQEAVRMMKALLDYDEFQLDNNIKPDYFNVCGLQMWDETLTDQDLIDMGLEDRWVEWFIETEDDYYDDPVVYIEEVLEKGVNNANCI